MGNCTQCGKEIKTGQDFCTNCGTTVIQKSEPTVKQRSEVKSVTFLQTKKFRFLAIIVVILIAALFTGYKLIESKNHPAKIVQQFEKAVDTKDTKKLAQLLNGGQDQMEVNENDAKLLIAYFEDHPDYQADVIESLRNEANSYEKENVISPSNENELFLTLVEAKKKWLIFTQYGLSFEPVYFVVSANQPKVSITINDKKQAVLEEDDEKTLGPFLPIEHEIVASYKGTYGTATVKEKADPLDYDDNKIDIELDLSENNVILHSNYDDAIVFINGKSTGKTVNELESFGPVSTDGSVKLHAEITEQGQTLKSEEVTISENGQAVSLYIDDTPIYEAKAREEEAEAELEQAEADIEDVIYEHYDNISYGYYSEAYDLFSASRKGKVDFGNWEQGLLNNISNTVKLVTVESVNGSNATASFEMVSRDTQENGDILVQTWGGKWHLVKEYSGWRLSEPEISKLDSRVE